MNRPPPPGRPPRASGRPTRRLPAPPERQRPSLPGHLVPNTTAGRPRRALPVAPSRAALGRHRGRSGNASTGQTFHRGAWPAHLSNARVPAARARLGGRGWQYVPAVSSQPPAADTFPGKTPWRWPGLRCSCILPDPTRRQNRRRNCTAEASRRSGRARPRRRRRRPTSPGRGAGGSRTARPEAPTHPGGRSRAKCRALQTPPTSYHRPWRRPPARPGASAPALHRPSPSAFPSGGPAVPAPPPPPGRLNRTSRWSSWRRSPAASNGRRPTTAGPAQ
mmetsp:Transcript_65123/g.201637  ORF Transcript_65123/g.201637 Transcript_65123/m.201637 type:complete len:277 (-) Transcript_65123:85-915(-)